MKCSHCYSDNQPWATVCSACGQSVLRLEFCPRGHLLPPGVRDCPVCPSLWPEVDAFAGPPVLRGLLWVEQGRLAPASDPHKKLAFLEIRDQEAPLGLTVRPSGTVCVVGEDDPDSSCRILMRPSGVKVCCRRPGQPSAPPAYQPLPCGERFDLGGATLRHLGLQPPVWVEKLAGSL